MRRRRIPIGLAIAIAALGAHAFSAAWALPAREETAGFNQVAPVGSEAVALAIRKEASGALKRFYADRQFRPIWAQGGKISAQADTLIGFLGTSSIDGLDPASYDVRELRDAIRQAHSGEPQAVARAELALTAAFVRYVRDLRRPGRVRMIYADRKLKPKKLRADKVLYAATFSKSFEQYVASMGWMSPHYVRLRELVAAAEKHGVSKEVRERLALNLDRARLLPSAWTHHIVVDASSGRLWYYGDGKQAGTMRVVVGAPETQTPMLAGSLQWAVLNPYWNVPIYLAQKSIAAKVMAGRSLASMRMEALSDWGASPRTLDESTIDWASVASGKQEVRLRQLPGRNNSMGRVKFVFPNKEGIYLHDTPDRALFKESDRHFSNGCIRLENAAELGRWLLQRPIRANTPQPEQVVPLPVRVPVYLTYITATASSRGVGFREDVYGRDR